MNRTRIIVIYRPDAQARAATEKAECHPTTDNWLQLQQLCEGIARDGHWIEQANGVWSLIPPHLIDRIELWHAGLDQERSVDPASKNQPRRKRGKEPSLATDH